MTENTDTKQFTTLCQSDKIRVNFGDGKVNLSSDNIDESPTVLGTVETDINMKQN